MRYSKSHKAYHEVTETVRVENIELYYHSFYSAAVCI